MAKEAKQEDTGFGRANEEEKETTSEGDKESKETTHDTGECRRIGVTNKNGATTAAKSVRSREKPQAKSQKGREE